jgi:uncharacterized damage-inducible protein DinB
MNYEDAGALLDYHYWARHRLLDALAPLSPEHYTRDLGSSFKSIRDTAVHIYSAEWAWYSRWRGNSPTALLPADKFPDVAALRSAWRDLEREVRAFLHELGPAGMDRRFEYKMTSGQPGSAVFWQVLQHVVNHASYHRGQLTTMLRQTGAAPTKSMDLIVFYREREASAPQGRTA